MTMDSTTYGLALDAGGYRTKVEFATRISNGGEFVHSAPWSVAQQGRENVSHGCINLSPANAAWFYGIANPGDVVEVRGTPVPLTSKDTDIPDWTIPWSRWVN
jgi:lipoprotein-anchoring transpeptidase ErfK/SrfK